MIHFVVGGALDILLDIPGHNLSWDAKYPLASSLCLAHFLGLSFCTQCNVLHVFLTFYMFCKEYY